MDCGTDIVTADQKLSVGSIGFGADIRHVAIRISGIVQGVGFRPFIYNLAKRCRLTGSVLNDNGGVLIHAQGPERQLLAFLGLIRDASPPAAQLDAVTVSTLPPAGYADFEILPSIRLQETSTGIPPDIAICPDCRREMHDPQDRRFAHPFINCTNCGPRFTITSGLPYDRPLTTMSSFVMCPECGAEYANPSDRRFHAQPVACPNCGPKLTFLELSASGWNTCGNGDDAVGLVVKALRERKIILLQGIGGLHLACDCRDEPTVQKLRLRKRRYEKPFAVMFPDLDAVHRWCEVSAEEEKLLTSPAAPIMLLSKRAECPAAPSVAPDNPLIGAVLPYSPLHLIILERFGSPLVMTSANLDGEPMAYKQDDALGRLRATADAALVHDREIHIFADDSVVRLISSKPRFIRRARGYVPGPIRVSGGFRRDVLAFGPQHKNTICLGRGNSAILSQHIGDMDSEGSWVAHRRAMDHLIRLFNARIELCACDLHPDYTTTRLAEDWCRKNNTLLIKVQHHHAHLAACLVENGEAAPAIGLCLDGTGYGTDGTIWGGEVLVGNATGYERVGHLLPIPMPGGELASKQPWRMASAWLHHIFGERWLGLPLRFVTMVREQVGNKNLEMLLNPHLLEGYCPLTTSLGRLFDAVAALLFFGTRHQYEGQAAAQLEWMISPQPERPYPVDIEVGKERMILSPSPMFQALVEDLQAATSPAIISRRFHEWIVDGFARICRMTRERCGVNTIALSGGCFQNAFLLSGFLERLKSGGFQVLTHREVPSNDGGVALGQAVVADSQVR
ncbi:MAG: carbamoyltransferase HypF [Calditrichaeota bacterium]|nr:carbamoyltransferase HypF [Calditrichota bacterium]